MTLLKGVERLISARGQKVTEIDLKKEKRSLALVQTYMLGPTGNLRAPTFRIGNTLMVGFNKDAYQELLR